MLYPVPLLNKNLQITEEAHIPFVNDNAQTAQQETENMHAKPVY